MTKKVWIVSEYVNKKELNESVDKKSVKEPNTPVARKYLHNCNGYYMVCNNIRYTSINVRYIYLLPILYTL